MRAVAVRRFGGPVELVEIPAPSPAAGEVAVRIEAAGMNPFDWKIADGAMRERRPHVFPLVLGVDGAGVVESQGEGASRFRPGDRIAGSFLHTPVGVGTYAEHTAVPETNCIVALPSGFSARDAAALPTAGMTALQSLDRLSVPAGGSVLIVGASGGVGSIAVSLARARGWTVVAAARTTSHERLRRLGAADTLEIEDGPLPPPPGRSVDGLLDVASPPSAFEAWARWLKPGGSAVSTIGSARPLPGKQTVSISMEPSADDLRRLIAEVERGALKVPLERTIRLEDAPGAVQESRAGRASGKTVIVP
jgi:NADPH2:quinone reductase